MKKILLSLLCLFLFSGLFARKYTISAIETEENSVVECYGESVSIVKTENNIEISLSMNINKNTDEIRVCVDIKNLGDEVFKFDERNIRVFQGNYDDMSWSEMTYLPATKYYEQAESDARFRTVMAAVGLGLAAIDSGLAPDPFFLPVPVPSFPVPGVRHGSHKRYYEIHKHEHDLDPAFVGLGIANLFSTLDENESTLAFLEDHLLYSAEINPNEGYSGIFFIPKEKGPDFKISLRLARDEIKNFYFTRSDKEEVLNPWGDFGRTKVSMNFVSGVQFVEGCVAGSYNFGCFWLTNNIGGYFDIGCGNASSSEVSYLDFIQAGGGVTTKIAPHVWVNGGLGLEYIDVDYSSLSKQNDKYVWTFGPELGMNFNFGVLDFGFMTRYRLFNTYEFDLSLGFSF